MCTKCLSSLLLFLLCGHCHAVINSNIYMWPHGRKKRRGTYILRSGRLADEILRLRVQSAHTPQYLFLFSLFLCPGLTVCDTKCACSGPGLREKGKEKGGGGERLSSLRLQRATHVSGESVRTYERFAFRHAADTLTLIGPQHA